MILSGPLAFAIFERVFTALNRAAELWNKKYHEFLTKYQLIPSTADTCVYCSFLKMRFWSFLLTSTKDWYSICPKATLWEYWVTRMLLSWILEATLTAMQVFAFLQIDPLVIYFGSAPLLSSYSCKVWFFWVFAFVYFGSSSLEVIPSYSYWWTYWPHIIFQSHCRKPLICISRHSVRYFLRSECCC